MAVVSRVLVLAVVLCSSTAMAAAAGNDSVDSAQLVRQHPREAMQKAIAKRVAKGVKPEAAREQSATALANKMAPYGPSTSMTWKRLRQDPQLDCDNYADAASYLYRVGGGRNSIRHLGFDGGPFGNHAQLQIGKWILDPTIGVVADAPGVLAGKPARKIQNVGNYRYPDQTFRHNVVQALKQGQYRPDQVIYDFRTKRKDLQGVRRQMSRILAGSA